MATLKLTVAYDGTDFRGLAPNDGVRTVVGELQRVLAPLVGGTPDIVMSGRTDAGVHGWGQVLSLQVPDDGSVDPARLQRSANARLGPEIVVRSIEVVDDGFSARFSATGRRYRYHVLNRPVPDPFTARTAWWVAEPLDLAAMSSACPHLIGEHDFSSFCRRPKPAPGPDGVVVEPSLVRRVTGARWVDLGDDLLRFKIEGSAFCHQMVRSIVGLLVAIGTGRRAADEVPAVLAARDRAAAAQPAPPHGLTLWQVDYDQP
ncbi:MAG: tRNA pseudouridine(38-40) synthase TruA [Actinomycetota bacterium]